MFGTVLTTVFANLLLLMLSQGRASVDYMQYSFVKGGNKVETPNIQGCTSDFLLPDKPFLVIWNYPSASCEAQGIDLNLAAWDIIDNKNDVFAGDNMTIFYELGHWPTYNQKTGDIYNGGVPQVSGNKQEWFSSLMDRVSVVLTQGRAPRFQASLGPLTSPNAPPPSRISCSPFVVGPCSWP